MNALTLTVLRGRYGVARLDAATEVPDWTPGDGFVSVTRTADELSIICDESRIPTEVRCERDWRVLALQGTFEFGQIGVLLPIAQALAQARVSLLAVSTFDTDYVMVKHDRLEPARAALIAAGYRVTDGHR